MEDILKHISEVLLRQGTEAARQELENQLLKEQADKTLHGVQLAFDLIDKVEKLAADGHPAKQQIAKVVTESVLGRFARNGSGVQPEGGASPVDGPFSVSSAKSLPPSTGSPDASTEVGNQLPPPRNKVGRPKGSKNRPKPPVQ